MRDPDVLVGTQRHQVAVGAFEALQGRIFSFGALTEAEVGVITEVRRQDSLRLLQHLLEIVLVG